MIEDQNEVEAFKERSRAREEQSEGSGPDSEYEAKMLEAFVAKPEKPEKGLWYANAFAKYDVNGVDSMRWNWSWWAFFGGIWFLIYRKAYAAAGGLFLISIAAAFIPFAGLVIWVLSGGYSTYFVYKTYKAKKLQIEAAGGDENQRIDMMRVIGGYNTWAIWVGAIFPALIIVGILAAVAIPKLASTRDDAKVAMEVTNLSACVRDAAVSYTSTGMIDSSSQACSQMVCFNVLDNGQGRLTVSDSGSYEAYCSQAVQMADGMKLLTTHNFGNESGY